MSTSIRQSPTVAAANAPVASRLQPGAVVVASLSVFVRPGIMASFLSEQIGRLIRAEYKIRDEAAACRVVIESIPSRTPMKDHFFGRATSLTKSPVAGKSGLKRGDVIWTVEVTNAAVSELVPTPEGIYWVKAADGAVFSIAPQP